MSCQLTRPRLRAALATAGSAAVAVAVAVAVAMLATTATALIFASSGVTAGASVIQPAARTASPEGGLPIGPVKLSPLGHPKLCWEAWGNGSPITLQSCDTTLQGQEWTFTANGVLMNGNGYCLQNGGSAQSSSSATGSLYLSFTGQCAGSKSQNWTFTGATDSIENPPGHLCASVPGGTPVTGATLVARGCGSTGSWASWSQGDSDLTLSGPNPQTSTHTHTHSNAKSQTGAGSNVNANPQSGSSGAGGHRAFSANVTVSNGAKAMTAYTASVALRLPTGLTATKLTGTGALSGWTCRLHTLDCRGNLPGSSTGSITVTGTVFTRTAVTAVEGPVTAHATVVGTNQVSRARLTAAVPARMYASASTGAAPTSATHGMPTGPIATFGVIVAILLVVGGLFLAFTSRRRQQSPAP